MKPIEHMHAMFGEMPDKRCKDCSNLIIHEQSRRWYKCSVFGESCSPTSDFRLKWTACGMYNKDWVGTPIKDYVKKSPRKKDIVLDGQMELKL